MPLTPFESSIAERYHEETKYSEEGFRREMAQGGRGAWEQPAPFKRYEGPRVLLPTEGLPLVRRRDEDEDETTPAPEPSSAPGEGRIGGRVDLAALSRILWHTNGCTRIVQMGGGVHHFRAAPSAGAMYPTEVYLAVRGVAGIDDGVYDFQILDHSLARVAGADAWDALEAACFGHPAVERAAAVVLLTAEWLRSACRYRERGYRRALLDTGHVLGNLVEAAPGEGLAAIPIACFRDDLVERLLGVDPIQEGPLVVVPLVAEGDARTLPPPPLHVSLTTEWRHALHVVGERVPEEEQRRLSAALHLAGRLAAGAPACAVASAAPLAAPADAVAIDTGRDATRWSRSEPVTDTIAERRSTRSFRPGELPRETLFRALSHAVPEDFRALAAPGLLRTFVVAMHVAGVPPGTYAWDPVARRAIELSRHQYGAAMFHLGLGQEIFVHAAAALIHTVDLTRAVERLGDRVYRLLGLDAGHIGERLHLALLREGFGVSGCGGYYDDEMNRVLSIPESQAVVYITSVGLPAAD